MKPWQKARTQHRPASIVALVMVVAWAPAHGRVILPRVLPAAAVEQASGTESTGGAKAGATGGGATLHAVALPHATVRKPAQPQPQTAPQSSTHSAPHSAPPVASDLHEHIVRSAALWQMDPYLVKAVIQAESAFNPRAVSPKNAIGLMQVLPSTAAEMGLRPRNGMSLEQLLMDARVCILVGTKYLAQQLERFGQVDLALAAYNAGPGAVVSAGRRVPPFAETRTYVGRVLALYAQYRHAGTLRGAGA